MLKKLTAAALAALVLLPVPATAAQAADSQQVSGTWRNPRNTVHVRIQPCGSNVCGTVVWATPEGIEAARRGGTPNLIGTQLFRRFNRAGDNRWSGQVFVPDMNRTFSGSIRLNGPNALIARGCVLGIICKSQTWVRIG